MLILDRTLSNTTIRFIIYTFDIICLENFSKCSYSSSMIVQSTHLKRKLTCSRTFFFNIIIDNLIDISRFFYFNSIECSSSITKTKILTIIKQFVFDKISSFDDFINKLFKVSFIMIKLLIFLFETYIQLFYHSKISKKSTRSL